MWPVIASYVAAFAGLTAVAAVYIAAQSGALGAGGATPIYAFGAGALFISALAVASVPMVYAWTAEEKHDDDDGTSIPGFFAPGHPERAKY